MHNNKEIDAVAEFLEGNARREALRKKAIASEAIARLSEAADMRLATNTHCDKILFFAKHSRILYFLNVSNSDIKCKQTAEY